MAGDPRIEFEPGRYVRIRYWDGDREWYYYVHRLVAYAHGEIDDPFADETIHHRDEDRWNNRPSNLQAVEPAEHSAHHARRNHETGAW